MLAKGKLMFTSLLKELNNRVFLTDMFLLIVYCNFTRLSNNNQIFLINCYMRLN